MKTEKILQELALELADLIDIYHEATMDLENAFGRKSEERIKKYRLFKRGIEARINQTIKIAEMLGISDTTLNQAANKLTTVGA